jgi:hypothetical protein
MFSMLARSLAVGLFAAGALFGAVGVASADGDRNGDYGVWRHNLSTSTTSGTPKVSVPAIPAPGGGIRGGPFASAGQWINN